MRRALVTFAIGDEANELLRVALPGFRQYAQRHGYELLDDAPEGDRPPSWLKVPLLSKLLKTYDEVLWLDADVVIVNESWDVADDVPPDDWQALVRHCTPDGEVPNCGVWLLRPPMRDVLDALWQLDEYRDHVWWEQAALLELLGYRGHPVALERPTELYARTCWLGLEWNSHEERDRHPSPRFAHATAGPFAWRLDVMHRYSNRPLAAKGAAADA